MKGFTLIELLAVIVILAIIALIATPIVLSIINDTKESAVKRSAEFYVDAVQSKIMQENMKQGGTLNPSECIINNEGNVNCDGTQLEIEVNGRKPSSGSITFDKGKVTGVNLTFGDRNVTLNTNGELVLGDKAEQKLAPGLYDENNNLLISWEDLTSIEYESFTYYSGDVEVTFPILRVDENGVLRTAHNVDEDIYYSSSRLYGKLVIDESVTSIEEYALPYSELTSVIIPNGVTSVGDYAFYECISLINVTLGNGITSIGEEAFYNCNRLTTINYKGSEANWNTISKGNNWDLATPSNKVINYNYTG